MPPATSLGKRYSQPVQHQPAVQDPDSCADDIFQDAFVKVSSHRKATDLMRIQGMDLSHHFLRAIRFQRRRRSEPAMVAVETTTISLERLMNGLIQRRTVRLGSVKGLRDPL